MIIGMSACLLVLLATNISNSDINLVLGIFVLSLSIIKIFKKDSTKSWVPILEQVAIYEKQKMGREWKKQSRVAYYANLIVGIILISQSFLLPDIKDYKPEESGLLFIFIPLIIFFTLFLNIIMYFHIKKVDNAKATSDLRGYTGDSLLIGFVSGLIIAVIFVALTLFYVLRIFW